MEEKRQKYGKMLGRIGILCNIVLAVSKLLIGLLSGMVSIVADAINNFSDAASSIISLIGFKISEKPADEEHPFGHARFEYISGLVVAFLVMIAGVELLKTGVDKIIHPTDVEYSVALFLVLAISILVKFGMAIANYKIGRRIQSTLILAAAADSRNDVITTSSVLVAALISMIFHINIDGIMAVLVALFILFSGVMLIKDTIEPLLGTTPDPKLVNEIEKTILSYDGILGTHDLVVHDYGPGRLFASVHAEVPAERNVLECHEIIDKIEQDFLEKKQLKIVIHYDPIVTSDEAVGSIRGYLKEETKKIYDKLTIHDLRIVPGENQTNVIFDCVVPSDSPVSEDEIMKILTDKLAEKYPHHVAVIKIDHSFVSVN